ncbi:DUF3006 domain-containing protein [Bacilliculturomica massiliensis]|uniref:DUF3006 domain-containing protein n=1 Tax=Bacilliculturomica massiliensis TaxID=1917867 RepID=UPI0010325B8D|nr:DUF3006 domain-containing protein [Bacilliculturomica massiliensis]
MNYTIDRFEGDFAVIELEDGAHADMPRALIPPEAKEGDALTITVNVSLTEERRKRIGRLMDDLFAD